LNVTYDKYYQTEKLFGDPYPELIAFFSQHTKKATVLDVGCGQGRNAIALARLGYIVTGIDNSKVGIQQLNKTAKAESLDLDGQLGDMYTIENFHAYDIILLDSIFHFNKKDREKESGLVRKIFTQMRKGCLVVFCMQDKGDRIQILHQMIDFDKSLNRLAGRKFRYIFEDKTSGHTSATKYQMIVVEKNAL
jgi:2-polyprenyl-3-methyl-5-hydroxy-6-metoxy-1,4-benzoquinol methylase